MKLSAIVAVLAALAMANAGSLDVNIQDGALTITPVPTTSTAEQVEDAWQDAHVAPVVSAQKPCPFCPEKPPWQGGACPEWCEWSPDGDDQACQYYTGHSRSCQVKTIAAPCYFVVEADTSFVNHFSCSQSTDTATCESLLKVRAESPGPCAAVNFKTCCQVDSAPWSPVPIAELWFDWSRQEGYPTNARFHSCGDLPKTGHPLREGGVTSNGKPCAGH